MPTTTPSLRRLLLAVAALFALLGGSAAPAAADTALGAVAPGAYHLDGADTAAPLTWEAPADIASGDGLDHFRAMGEVVTSVNLRTRTRPFPPYRRCDTPQQVCLRERERAVLSFSFSLQSLSSHLLQTGIAPPQHSAA